MKLENPKNKFEPVSITITFESKDELIALYNRMIINTDVVEMEYLRNITRYKFNNDVDESLADKLFVWVSDKLGTIE